MPSETLFPHLTSTTSPPSYREVVSTYRNVLATRFAEGTLRPLVIPYNLYGGFLLMLYLCIPHKSYQLVYKARWLVLGTILWFEWKTIWVTSSQSMATALACGLVAAWAVIWSVTWLVFRRPQWDTRRVQRKAAKKSDKARNLLKSRGNTPTKDRLREDTSPEQYSGKDHLIDKDLRKRERANGHAKTKLSNGHVVHNGSAEGIQRITNEYVEGDDENTEYYWQSYPENTVERISFITDLIMNFRGPGWNWAIAPLPDLPQSIKLKLGDADKKSSSVGMEQYKTRLELFNARMPQFIIGYYILDFVKVIMLKDPYYIFGPTTYALPPHLASLSPIQLRIYREVLSATAIIVSLQMTFSLVPLYMSLICGPKVYGQRAEAWYFPSYWGSFSNITNKGLNGLWGGWWHQTFRFAFSAPSNYLIEKGYFKPRSATAKFCALVFAFGISGFLHTCGSISQVPETNPWAAPIFFMLQALGISIQITLSSVFRPQIDRLPKLARQAGNLGFTIAWLIATGWILVDDFSRGGIWLYEPIPISPLRGLGFGVEGDGWWCWDHIGVSWYKGKHWWESGIAL